MEIDDFLEKIKIPLANKLMYVPTIEPHGSEDRIKIAQSSAGVNNTLFNTNSGNITIGEEVCFGHNVCLLTGTHDIRKKGKERKYKFPKDGRDIVVEDGVWLASNVTVLGPCVIGENSVIAAGSLVTEDVKPNSVYAGIPAKFIKDIDFDDE